MAKLGSTGRRGAPPPQSGAAGGYSAPPPQIGVGPRQGIPPPPQRFTPTRPGSSGGTIGRIAEFTGGSSHGWSSLYKRPLSTLGAVFRVLGVGENVAVGFGKSIGESQEKFSDLMSGRISPWAYVTAAVGEGGAFTEIASAVKENKTYEQWIRESQDPDSFLYENAFVLGLGLSIFGDPTTYLTFGTTAGSKIAAQKLMAHAWNSTADEASEALITGTIRQTGENVGDYGYDLKRVMGRIHEVENRPWSPGDALRDLRLMDKGKYPGMESTRGPVKGALRGAFARGGQGVRFAGMEIPGSREIAPAIGRAFGAAPGTPAREDVISAFKYVIPNEKLLRVMDDVTRSVFMSEYTRANQHLALMRTGAYEDALAAFAVDPVKGLPPANAPWRIRSSIAMRNLFEKVPRAVPKNARMDLLKSGHRPTGQWGPRLKEIREEIYASRDASLREAEDLGLPESTIDSLRTGFDNLVASNRDPVDVWAHWLATAEAAKGAHNAMASIMYNPLIARPMLEGGDELARLEDEMAELNEKIAVATSRLNEKPSKPLRLRPRSDTHILSTLKEVWGNDPRLLLSDEAAGFGLKQALATGVPMSDQQEDMFADLIHMLSGDMPDEVYDKFSDEAFGFLHDNFAKAAPETMEELLALGKAAVQRGAVAAGTGGLTKRQRASRMAVLRTLQDRSALLADSLNAANRRMREQIRPGMTTTQVGDYTDRFVDVTQPVTGGPPWRARIREGPDFIAVSQLGKDAEFIDDRLPGTLRIMIPEDPKEKILIAAPGYEHADLTDALEAAGIKDTTWDEAYAYIENGELAHLDTDIHEFAKTQDYTETMIQTREDWMSNIIVRKSKKKGKDWIGIFPETVDTGNRGPGLRIPTNEEIDEEPWKGVARAFVERGGKQRIIVGTSGIDHEDLGLMAAKQLGFDDAQTDKLFNGKDWLQSTITFRDEKIQEVHLDAMMEDILGGEWVPGEGRGVLRGKTSDELKMTNVAFQKLKKKTKTAVEEFYETAHPKVKVTKRPKVQAKVEAAVKDFLSSPRRVGPAIEGRPAIGGVADEAAARAAIGENAVPYRWGGKKWWVQAPVAEALDEMRNPQFIDIQMKKWFRGINYTQNKWKILATSLNPRFHVMNFIGGTWNNMLGGVYNPGDYGEQTTSMLRHRISRVDQNTPMGKALKPIINRLDQDKLARDRAFIDAVEERNVSGGAFISHEAHPEYDRMKAESKFQTRTGKYVTRARRGFAVTAVGTALAPDEWVPDELEDNPLFSPLLGVAAGLPELARAGRYLASDVETMLRETPVRVAQKDPSLWQMTEAYSITPPVNFGRWMGETDVGKTAAARELIYDIGAAMALRYQFDYSNLTNFERYFAKTIFPFYVFNKNNFVLQAQELAQRPRFLAVTGDVMNFSTQMTGTEENDPFQAILPEYFDKLAMFRVPVPHAMRDMMGLPQDQDLYLNPTLPFASLNLFPAFWQVAQDDTLTPTNSRWLQVMAPLFGLIGPNAVFPMAKPMFEYSIGYNLGLARPIDYQQLQSGGWRSSYREAPNFMKYVPKQLQNMFGVYKDPQTGLLMQESSLAYISEQMASPFMNASGDIFNWGQGGVEADRTRANNFAFITGIRLTPVDPLRLQRSFLYRLENFLEGEKANAKRLGKTFSREDNQLLTRVRAQLRGVESEWDRKQAELYGEK